MKDESIISVTIGVKTSFKTFGYFKRAGSGSGVFKEREKVYEFKPKRGSLAIWWSCGRDGKKNEFTHGSQIVKKGIRWTATTWASEFPRKGCQADAAEFVEVPEEALYSDPKNSAALQIGEKHPPDLEKFLMLQESDVKDEL